VTSNYITEIFIGRFWNRFRKASNEIEGTAPQVKQSFDYLYRQLDELTKFEAFD